MKEHEEESKLQESDITDELYESPTGKTKKIILILTLSGILGFIMNFPLHRYIENHIKRAISSNNMCPMSYDSVSVSLILLKVKINNLVIPRRCISPSTNSLRVKKSCCKHWTPRSLSP